MPGSRCEEEGWVSIGTGQGCLPACLGTLAPAQRGMQAHPARSEAHAGSCKAKPLS